jgi:hypothetical protein
MEVELVENQILKSSENYIETEEDEVNLPFYKDAKVNSLK